MNKPNMLLINNNTKEQIFKKLKVIKIFKVRGGWLLFIKENKKAQK